MNNFYRYLKHYRNITFTIIFLLIFVLNSMQPCYADSDSIDTIFLDHGNNAGNNEQYPFIFNIRGNGDILTTYRDRGYCVCIKEDNLGDKFIDSLNYSGSYFDIDISGAPCNDGHYVNVIYTITNRTDTAHTISLSTFADIQINTNDKAPISKMADGRGVTMSGDGYTFNFLGKNTYRVTDVDTLWFGNYAERVENKWANAISNSLTDIDSGIAWSWQNRTVGAHQSVKFSVLIGVGTFNTPPTLSISTPTKTYRQADTVSIQTTVKDADIGDTLSLHYLYDNGAEQTYRSIGSATGTDIPFTMNYTLPSNIQNGQHSLTLIAYDNKGNASAPCTYTFNVERDETPPVLTLSAPQEYTKGNVTITATATDTQSGIKSIKLPNGNVVNSSNTTFSATDNGTYTFIATDNKGNTTTKSITISCIDRDNPEVSLQYSKDYCDELDIQLTAKDTGSGIKSVCFNSRVDMPLGETHEEAYMYKVKANGTYKYSVTDRAGNTITKSITITNINKPVKSIPTELLGNTTVNTLYLVDPNIQGKYGTINVNLGSGENIQVPIIWNTSEYNITALGEYTVSGTLDLSRTPGITNPSNLSPSLTVNVLPANISSVQAVPNIEVSTYQPFSYVNTLLPSKLPVLFENGRTIECNITWSQGSFSSTDESLVDKPQIILGEITLPDNYMNTNAIKASATVTVRKTNINLTSTEQQLNHKIQTEYNTDIATKIPQQLTLNLENGQTLTVNVTYDVANYNRLKLGTQVFEGTIQENILINNIPKPNIQVEVTNTTLCNKPLIEDIHTLSYMPYEKLNLPNQVNVDYTNGETNIPCNVEWNTTDYNPLITGTQTIHGLLKPEYGYQGEADLTMTCTVTTSKASITKVNKVYSTDVDWGTPLDKIVLPTEAEVTLDSDSHVMNIPVTFDLSSYDPKYVGIQTFEGTLDLSKFPLRNQDDIKAIYKINITNLDLEIVEILENIQKDAYTPFDKLALPQKQLTTFYNEVTGTRESFECPIHWHEDEYNPQNIDNLQIIRGDIEIPEGYLNTKGLQSSISVQLVPAEIKPLVFPETFEVEYGTMLDKIQIPQSLTTTIIANNEQINIPIKYDMTKYDAFTLGKQSFTGQIISDNPLLDLSQIEVPDLIINVIPSEIVSVKTPDWVFTGHLGDSYSKLITPEVNYAVVTLGSGIDYQVNTSWNENSYDYTVYTQELKGEFVKLPDGILNTSNHDIHMTINLERVVGGSDILKAPTLPVIKIAKNTSISNIPYLYRVPFSLTSGQNKDIEISYWNSSEVDVETVGSYNATAVLLPDDYTNTKDIILTQPIEVVEVAGKSVAEVVTLPPIQIAPKEVPKLPEKVNVIYSDGTVGEENISFENAEIVTLQPGVTYIEGTLIGTQNPLGIKPIQEIDVIDLWEDNRYIVEVKDAPTLQAPVGTSIKDLPLMHSIMARLSDNRWVYTSIISDTTTYDSSSLALQQFIGDLVCGSDYTNPLKIKACNRIKLFEAGSPSDSEIIKVVNPTSIAVPYNTPYTQIAVPNAVVQLANGKVTLEKAPWVLTGFIPNQVGIQTFEGVIHNLEAILDVKVLPDKNDPDGILTVVGLTHPEDITIQKGSVLRYTDLPDKIRVTLRNTNQIDLPVEWNYKGQSINRPIQITGVVQLPDNMYTVVDLKTMINVQVKAASDEVVIKEQKPEPEITVKPEPTPVNDLEDQLARERELIRKTSLYIPYTLPYEKAIKYETIIPNLDLKKITITPDIFHDDSIVEVNLITTHLRGSKKALIIKPEPTVTKDFKDVQNTHWAYDAVKQLRALGYVKGVDGEYFNPKGTITVADTFTFMDRILVNNGKLKVRNTRDTVERLLTDNTHWAFYNTASILSKIPLETIYTIFNTSNIYSQELTREQVAVILHDILTQFNIQSNTYSQNYVDANTITYKKQVDYCTALGLFYGDTDGNFNPEQEITRAELVSVLLRLDSLLK